MARDLVFLSRQAENCQTFYTAIFTEGSVEQTLGKQNSLKCAIITVGELTRQ